MSNVLVNKDKIDILANAISNKSGEPLTLTLDEMVEAVDGIEAGGGTPTLEIVTKTYTPSTSAVTDTITPSAGYDGIEEVDVTVSAVPMASFYSETVPLDYSTENNNRVWKIKAQTVLDPGEGDTEGWISAGYYDGGTRTYNAIAKNTTITPTTSSQTIGGANYMMEGAVTVSAIPTGTAGTPTATKGTVSNHAVTVTPSVTNTAGYISGGTKTGTGVSVSASELVSGSQTITSNQTVDVTNLAEVVVNVASGSSKNTQVVQSTTRTNASTLTAIGSELTVSTTGTYDIYYSCFRTNTSSSYTWATRLYINGTAYGTAENTTWTNNQQNTHLSNISLTAGDKLRVYGRNTRGTSYYVCCPSLIIVEA